MNFISEQTTIQTSLPDTNTDIKNILISISNYKTIYSFVFSQHINYIYKKFKITTNQLINFDLNTIPEEISNFLKRNKLSNHSNLILKNYREYNTIDYNRVFEFLEEYLEKSNYNMEIDCSQKTTMKDILDKENKYLINLRNLLQDKFQKLCALETTASS
ncbi:hypothetical protein PPL_01852 [Heterostelium album PN500]|uniref:Uncharacterized protein n=1 Tax=Heterostelium pallidum (strain ATCC 26659 / Pp 5 / PN500) TaxID=670386 RepID=D3B0N5_HETP5|nr:hypothetical protein PPL_01852 [Heterostelium album PN500]EFA84859.1 hypothetical protein PPL_01852 [Heterostelium album PN500]|eukprot:XP_020436970.1 hypothetical protein PPL_01852 [Heterostelium album PN500]